ncbi:hypothetical protein ES703_07490 [subsurface metagenome]
MEGETRNHHHLTAPLVRCPSIKGEGIIHPVKYLSSESIYPLFTAIFSPEEKRSIYNRGPRLCPSFGYEVTS